MNDYISRQAAIDALWKALYEYEDKTERMFMESNELDVGDWMVHRIFVQDMNDIDRQTILNLPSADVQPRKTAEWVYGEKDGADGDSGLNRYDVEVGLTQVPSVDAVEVVRCRDCEHYFTSDMERAAMHGAECTMMNRRTMPEDYCSYGQKM